MAARATNIVCTMNVNCDLLLIIRPPPLPPSLLLSIQECMLLPLPLPLISLVIFFYIPHHGHQLSLVLIVATIAPTTSVSSGTTSCSQPLFQLHIFLNLPRSDVSKSSRGGGSNGFSNSYGGGGGGDIMVVSVVAVEVVALGMVWETFL